MEGGGSEGGQFWLHSSSIANLGHSRLSQKKLQYNTPYKKILSSCHHKVRKLRPSQSVRLAIGQQHRFQVQPHFTKTQYNGALACGRRAIDAVDIVDLCLLCDFLVDSNKAFCLWYLCWEASLPKGITLISKGYNILLLHCNFCLSWLSILGFWAPLNYGF